MTDLLMVSVLLVKLFYFSGSNSFADMQSDSDKNVSSSPGTEKFVQELKTAGFSPVIVKKIRRFPRLAVEGRLVAFNGDNFQVFEYPDHESAMRDASPLAVRYTSSSRSAAWKGNIHLYVDNTLLIFYMGNSNSIVDSLNKSADLSLMQPLNTRADITKASNGIKL